MNKRQKKKAYKKKYGHNPPSKPTKDVGLNPYEDFLKSFDTYTVESIEAIQKTMEEDIIPTFVNAFNEIKPAIQRCITELAKAFDVNKDTFDFKGGSL